MGGERASDKRRKWLSRLYAIRDCLSAPRCYPVYPSLHHRAFLGLTLLLPKKLLRTAGTK